MDQVNQDHNNNNRHLRTRLKIRVGTGKTTHGINYGHWEMNSRRLEEDRPYINHLTFPSFDGAPSKFESYRYEVTNLKYQCSAKDFKFLAPKLISQFTGQIKDDFKNIEMDISRFSQSDGIEKLLDFLKERLHITDCPFEVKAFEGIICRTERKSGESMKQV